MAVRAPADVLLKVDDLRTQFFTRDGIVKAVDGVSFELKRGETLGIVGESGCGKSVTALSIMRLVPQPPGKIATGTIMFNGDDLLKMSDQQIRAVRGNQIAMIFQDPMTSLNPVLTIGRQISESLELHMRMTRRQARLRSVELLTLVGIPGPERRVDDYPHQFSGGMRQRAMIAMALSCNPQLLIADEPTTALDVTIQAQILDLIGNLRREFDTAVMMITHDLGVVAGVADKIIVMYAGNIIESGTTEEIFDNPRHPYTLGLLNSVPRLDVSRDHRLIPIEGLPPDLIDPPKGCRFAPRCPYMIEQCNAALPELRPVAPDHRAACIREVTKESVKIA